MRHQEIIFGVAGQAFVLDVPEWARPSGTPTLQVFSAWNDDDSAAPEAAAGACVVDAVNTVLAAAAARGASTIEVSDATAIAARRRYALVANGAVEIVEVDGVDGTTIDLVRPLTRAYDAGAALQGCRITAVVDTTWASTKSKLTDVMTWTIRTDIIRDDLESPPGTAGYRLRWAYTVNGNDTIAASFADLVRYPLKNFVTPLDVDDKYAGWIDRLPINHQVDQGTRLITEAFDNVRLDALGDAQVLRRVRETTVLHGLVVDQANVVALEAQESAGGDVAAQLELARKTYQKRYAQLVRAPKVPVDQAGGGASSAARPLPLFRR